MSDDSRLIEENPFSDEHLYRLIYSVKVQDPRLTKDEVPPGYGATDALLGVSVLYPEDGSLSVLFFSLDGRTGGVLEDKEWFKIWALLTKRLADSSTLSEGKKEFCRSVFETIRATLEPMRGEG